MIKSIDRDEFSIIDSLLYQQQLFHYNLDRDSNERFLKIGIDEFTEYMTKEDDFICLVSIKDTIPIGFIACTISNSIAYIEDLFILEPIRGTGEGILLMNSLIEELDSRDIKVVQVHVTKNNESVFNFYKKFDFELSYSDETGYILTKGVLYSDTKIFNRDSLVNLFLSVGWSKYSASYPDRLVNAMKNSDNVYSAWVNEELIGLISVIDDSMHAFIVYLCVRPEYQNIGIGKVLCNKILEIYNDYKIILTTDNDTVKYYEYFGFELDSVGMIKVGL